MVVPFGEIEDIVMMGPALGGMEAQLDMLIQSVKTSRVDSERDLHADIGGSGCTFADDADYRRRCGGKPGAHRFAIYPAGDFICPDDIGFSKHHAPMPHALECDIAGRTLCPATGHGVSGQAQTKAFTDPAGKNRLIIIEIQLNVHRTVLPRMVV